MCYKIIIKIISRVALFNIINGATLAPFNQLNRASEMISLAFSVMKVIYSYMSDFEA